MRKKVHLALPIDGNHPSLACQLIRTRVVKIVPVVD